MSAPRTVTDRDSMRPRRRWRDWWRPPGGQPPQRSAPWRVEGVGNDGGRDTGRPGGWGRLWWLLLILLVVNWIVSSLLMAPPAREKVSYAFFLA